MLMCSYMHIFFQTHVCTVINIFTYAAAAAFYICIFLGLIETYFILSTTGLFTRSSVFLIVVFFFFLACYIYILFF